MRLHWMQLYLTTYLFFSTKNPQKNPSQGSIVLADYTRVPRRGVKYISTVTYVGFMSIELYVILIAINQIKDYQTLL